MKPYQRMVRAVLVPAVCALATGQHAQALDLDSVRLEDSARVAGKSLVLNGAGVSRQLVFRIYAIGLYLMDRKVSAEEILSTDGPRRIAIAVLRDISSDDFQNAVADHVNRGTQQHDHATVRSQMAALVKAMDWVPETGTVVQINGKPLVAPMPGLAFYKALLSIWLGDSPADPSLKPKLLGRSLS
jgi:hypothetical protein